VGAVQVGFRRGRVFPRKRDERGVSGVVAASLGVVLISVLLGMVVTFWVPAWGYDSEVSHSRDVVNAFAQFKNALELQTLSGNTNQTVTTSFPLGVGGVPLFGAETPGQLSHLYLDQGRVRFRANLTDATGDVNFTAAGSLQYVMANRYFVRQEMAFESGALLVAQADGETARLTPPFRFENGTGGIEAFFTLFTLDGPEVSVTGVESHTVSTRLTLEQTRAYTFPGNGVIALNVTTGFPGAWADYFGRSMNASSLNASLFNITRSAPSAAPAAAEWASLSLSGLRSVTVTVALIEVRLD